MDASAAHAEASGPSREGRELIRRLRRTNLNLLPILNTVLDTKSIGQAARELNLTQPAVSQALRQLRVIFEDELIVMVGRVPALTEKAQALLGPLQLLMDQTDALLDLGQPFDPASEKLHVQIVTADYVALLLTPPLLALCARESPATRIDFVGIDIKRIEDLGQMDFAVIPRSIGHRLGKRMGSMPLWQDRIVCIAAADSPLPATMTREAIAGLAQLRFELDKHLPDQSHHLVQPAAGLENAGAWATENYLVLALSVAVSDRVALVPALLAHRIAQMQPLRIIEIEGAAELIAVDAFWSPQVADKRGHAWLRRAMREAAAAFTALEPAGSIRTSDP